MSQSSHDKSENSNKSNAESLDKVKHDLIGYSAVFASPIQHNLGPEISNKLQTAIYNYYNLSPHNLKLFDTNSVIKSICNLYQEILIIDGMPDNLKSEFVKHFLNTIKFPKQTEFLAIASLTEQWMDDRRWLDKNRTDFTNAVLPKMIRYIVGIDTDISALKKQIATDAKDLGWHNCDDLADDYIARVLPKASDAKLKL